MVGAELVEQDLVVGGAVGVVAREPDTEGLAREERRWAGEHAQVGEPARVVVAVPEEVAVLVGAGVGRPLCEARRGGGEQHRLAVVEQVPAGTREETLMQRDRPLLVVEPAAPAAEVLRVRVGCPARLLCLRPTRDVHREVALRERSAAALVANGHPARADHARRAVDR